AAPKEETKFGQGKENAMSVSLTPAPALDAKLSTVWRVEVSAPDVKAKPEKRPDPAAAQAEQDLENAKEEHKAGQEPGILQVHVDADAMRFVTVLLDPHSEEVIRQYPSESQLAYARAVNAYLRALEK